MNLSSLVRSFFKTLKRLKSLNAEIGDEMQFHLDCYRRDLVKSGLSEAEADARARREFGSQQFHREDCRQALGLRLVGEVAADMRYGVRTLRRDRVLTATALVSLALGIGANTAMFSVAKTVIFDSLRVENPEELRLLAWEFPGRDQPVPFLWGNSTTTANGNYRSSSFSYAAYGRLSEKHNLFRGLAAMNDIHELPVSVGSGSSEMAGTQLVSGNYFDVLGVGVARGRPLRESDMAHSASAVAVISDAFWSKHFGRSPAALGSVVRVSSVPVTIVGITSPQFRGAQMDANPAVTMPLRLQPMVDPAFDSSHLENEGCWWLRLLCRKRPEVSDRRLQAELNVVLQRTAVETLHGRKPEESGRIRLSVQPGSRGEDELRRRLAQPTLILWTLSGLVLLLACANIANLLLARGTARQREMAVRLALGAGRARIFRQLLVEGSLLATVGASAGLLFAYLLHRGMPALIAGLLPTTFDWQVCAFAVALAALTSILFGLAPAWQSSAVRPDTQENSRATQGGSKAILLRRALVLAQVALASSLLLAGGLFARTLAALSSVNLGVDSEHLLLVATNFSEKQYPDERRVLAQQRLIERIKQQPGVRDASVARDAVGSGDQFSSDFQRRADTKKWQVGSNTIDPGFFETAGIAMLRGRAILPSDTKSSRPVAVINERLARLAFGDENPIGQHFNGDTEIVGISANSRLGNLREENPPAVYYPFSQLKFWGGETIYVRTFLKPESAMLAVRAAMKAFDRNLPVISMRTQDEQVAASLTQERLITWLAGTFALLSLILGTIGVYGVTQFSVARKTAEIGIRMALGAQKRSIVAIVLREGLLLVGGGLVLGIAGALLSAHAIAALLYGVKATDTLTIAGVSVVLFASALIALLQPALRAASISPVTALRHQ